MPVMNIHPGATSPTLPTNLMQISLRVTPQAANGPDGEGTLTVLDPAGHTVATRSFKIHPGQGDVRMIVAVGGNPTPYHFRVHNSTHAPHDAVIRVTY